jgi:hypothetical protein
MKERVEASALTAVSHAVQVKEHNVDVAMSDRINNGKNFI